MHQFRPLHTLTLTPHLTVQDAVRSIAFDEATLGLSTIYQDLQDQKSAPAQMGMDGEQIMMFGPENAFGSSCKTPKLPGADAWFRQACMCRMWCDPSTIAAGTLAAFSKTAHNPATLIVFNRS